MMTTFEPGDIILFQTQERNFKSNIGMILKHKENGNYNETFSIFRFCGSRE